MKKLNDLLIKRSAKVVEMEQILKTATDGKRARTEDESKKWKAIDTEVRGLTTEIETLQRQDELNRTIADQKPADVETKKAVKRFDLAKAIREAGAGNLSGLEREMHDEGKKEVRTLGAVGNLFLPSMLIQRSYKRANEETKTTGLAAGHIPTLVQGADMGLVVPNPLYRELGATVYENLTAGKIDLPFSQGHSAALVAEEGAAAQSVPTDTKGTLTAGRFQGWQKYTQEYLSESAVMPGLMSDMIAAVDRAVGSALVNDAVAVAVMSGFATTDTGAALTWNGVLDMIAALKSDNFVSEGFVLSKQLFYELAATEKASGTAKFIVEGSTGKNKGSIFGINTNGTGFLPLHDTTKYDAIYGDWKQSYVGFWGGVQLLIDPFTASDNGYVKITFSRLGAVDSNPYAFASKRNATIS